MADYIDREKLIADLEEEIEYDSKMFTREQNYFFEHGLRLALKYVKRMQSEDVVPVVRCRDCKRYKQLYDITTGVKKPYGVCTRHNNRFTDEEVALDGFCMYGIRRIDDGNL